MRTKFVILPIQGCVGVLDTPFLFPETVSHADFVHMMGFSPEDVHSAGFAYFDVAARKYVPYGDSVSLEKGIAKDTADVFERSFR